MSSFSCPVVEFDFEKHPNADTLSIATIKGTGWTCVVKTDGWDLTPDAHGNVRGVYIPIGAIAAADHPLLDFLEGKKVKTCKLRKVVSQGVLLPLKEVMDRYSIEKYPDLGEDLSEILQVRKWEPPANTKLGQVSSTRKTTEGFNRYTNLEHLKNYVDVIQEGEQVYVTEKLHGTSARYGLIGNEYIIGTRNTELDLSFGKRKPNLIKRFFDKLFGVKEEKTVQQKQNVWINVSNKLNLEVVVRQISKDFKSKQVILYGEIVGPGVQDLTYNQVEPSFFGYDISIDGKYLLPPERNELFKKHNIPVVPVLYTGPWNDQARSFVDGKTVLGGKHCREGIVVEPSSFVSKNLYLHRVKLKLISVDYELRSGATDFEG